jgi:hypothetical protein
METQAIAPPAPRAAPTSTLAILSLVFGIASWLALPVVGSIAAIVCGHLARRDIRESRGAIVGDGLAVGGLVLGYLQIATILVAIFVALAFLGGIAALLAMIGLSAS